METVTNEPSEAFSSLLFSILSTKAGLKPKYLNLLMNKAELYEQAFTARSYNARTNYEMYEQLGDASVNKFLVWYFYRRFPQLRCPDGIKVVAKLKTNYSSKNSFAAIAHNLGFWPFIRTGSTSDTSKEVERKSLLEDVFEAFLGVTEWILDAQYQIGVGYAIVDRILTSIFDTMVISLDYEDLYDPKTRLKELFDINKELGILEYDHHDKTATVFQVSSSGRMQLGQGVAHVKKDAQQMAAAEALTKLKTKGYVREEDYSLFCGQ